MNRTWNATAHAAAVSVPTAPPSEGLPGRDQPADEERRKMKTEQGAQPDGRATSRRKTVPVPMVLRPQCGFPQTAPAQTHAGHVPVEMNRHPISFSHVTV